MTDQRMPGDMLLDRLKDIGMSQSELARRAGYSIKHVNQVCRGHDPVSAEFAVRTGLVTGLPAIVLLLRQTCVDLAVAKEKVRRDQVEWLNEAT